MRAKVVNFEENETDIAYLNKLEKFKGESNIISSLTDENGNIKEGSREILEIVFQFYAKLYKKEPESRFYQNFFLQNILKRISHQGKTDMDRPLDKEELFDSLCSLKGNKSPGTTVLQQSFLDFFGMTYPQYT